MTVSNVVNSRKGVSDEIRQRVLECIDSTGYRMNAAARQLRSGRSGVIGLAVPELDRPFFGQLSAGVTMAAKKRGYRVAVEQTGAVAAAELDAIQLSQAMQYDGLILSSVGLDLDRMAGAQNFPMVLLGERETPSNTDHIGLPNVEGIRAATAHLATQGAGRIGFVGGKHTEDTSIYSTRLNGYQLGLDDAGLAQQPQYSDESLHFRIDDMTMVEGRKAGHRIAESAEVPDGIVAITDTVAIGVIRGLADRGLRVPEDVMVIGFDDIAEAEFFTPSLSTIRPDHQWMAERAVDLVLWRIGMTGMPAKEEVAPFELKKRESTAR